MWSFVNVKQEVFVTALAAIGILSFFYGMHTAVKKPGWYKPKK